ncbi:MAG: hypothetical protein V3W34_11415 [Phycisphaerae bacterium]
MKSDVIRVYADSSVFGGTFDEEFAIVSRRFFDQVGAGRFSMLSSFLVADEVGKGPDQVRALFDRFLPTAELVRVEPESLALQAAYLSARIVSPKWSDDALHVALATVAEADLIVSWNFRHIVHFEKIRRYNAVNRLHGWRELGIHSPREVITYEDQDV